MADSRAPDTLPAEGLTGRALRARVEPMTVRALRDDRYVVETEGGVYVVDLVEGTCTCPDHAIRGARCKHLRRVAIEVNEGRVAPPGRRRAACAVCGRRLYVPVGDDGIPLCPKHELSAGDLVRDRESDKLLVVTDRLNVRADEATTEDGRLISAFPSNADYGGQEPVVEAVYLDSVGTDGRKELESLKRYRFPASRLRKLERKHGRFVVEEGTDDDRRD